MGVSDGSEGGIGSDCPVGTIVWVRRRNGSWWPGRILGPDELSASHLMSPRSGTPVKLLGREDASVDWYNLEKSKRVKAFRCGEFDACIERAEASQGIPIKKREKYARREDAILHALELEKQQIEMKHQRRGTLSNGIGHKSSVSHRRELNHMSSNNYNRDGVPGVSSKFANHKSHMFSKAAAALSWEEENKSNSLYSHKGRTGKLPSWEEENPETLPRMRGLQDFGLRIAPPKKKLSQSVAWEASRKPLDDPMDVGSNVGDVGASNTGSSSSLLAIKRKKSQDGNSEDSLVKKRDRRRPLVQVLKSSAKLPVSHSFQSDYDTGGISMEGERDNVGGISRAKRSRCVYLPANSNDSLDNNGYSGEEMPIAATQFGTGKHIDYPSHLAEECSSSSELAEETESDTSETDYLEPDMEEDGNLMTDAIHGEVPGFKDCDPLSAQNNNEMPLVGYIPRLHTQDQLMDTSADPGVSKWHMKGKRNTRNFAKRPVDIMDGKFPFSNKHNGSTNGSSFKSKQSVSFIQRYPFALQGVKDGGRVQDSSFNDSDNDSHMVVRRPYWEELDERFDLDYSDHLADEMEPMLIDVDIKVQNPSHQGEHVPFVSLMSRFNGKQILGHPVQIEILEDGSKYDLGLDESYAPPAFGRTAKRTTMHRIPRSNPTDPLDSDEEAKPPQRKPYPSYFNHQARLAKKSISHARRPTTSSKFQKKLLKRVNISSQKTRKLSSLGRASGNLKLNRRSEIFDGLIKPDGGAPLVTCVPVKVVFSRILEAIGRPRARIGSPAVRGPS